MRNIVGLFPLVVTAFTMFQCSPVVLAQDKIGYCNAVQNRDGFIRYPLGTVGIWSTSMGDIASAVTRVPRVYPCIDTVVARSMSNQSTFVKGDWRASISGDPSMMVVKYNPNKPSGPTTVAMTVSPHVAVFKVMFPHAARNKYLVFDFGKFDVDDWVSLNKWTQRELNLINDTTIEATISEPGKRGAFYTITFSAPCLSSGTIQDTSGKVTPGADKIRGTEMAIYVSFRVSVITVAVAESFTSMKKSEEFLASEYGGFDKVHKHCRAAWNNVLNRIDIEGSENAKRMAYTAIYTIYANIIDGSDGSVYTKYYPRPRDLCSSVHWQFIGGFQSCYWDNSRAAYPFLMLNYPYVMKHIVGLALARYKRDGFIDGNICLFTGPLKGTNLDVKFSPVLVAQAYENGVRGDYSKLYAALKDNFNSDVYYPSSILKLGYETQPPSGDFACSHTLEWATSMYSMALLAKGNHDPEFMKKYFGLSKIYANLWDSINVAFRVKNPDGRWGPVDYKDWTWGPNPQGLFEGTTEDWQFAVPHDPYGLLNLPGQRDFVSRVTNYCVYDTWFNDYQYNYPYLLYYDGAANEAQKIIRDVWVPLFNDGVMYEELYMYPPRKKNGDHYTSNSGWLISSMIGLYPTFAPEGQYIITSPSVTKAVIHRGNKDIIVDAKNNIGSNIYIQSIKVDGKIYPCYMISAKRLDKGAKIELNMGSDSTGGLGKLYISSTDGYVENAEIVSPHELRCTIDASVENATTKVYSIAKPVKVVVNGIGRCDWSYDETRKITNIETTGKSVIEVFTK